MVGYSEMMEVALWVQTTEEAEVYFRYRAVGAEKTYRTQTVNTSPVSAFTAKVIADSVDQGMEYTYTLFINGKEVTLDRELNFETQKLWQWREDPPAFTFLSVLALM